MFSRRRTKTLVPAEQDRVAQGIIQALLRVQEYAAQYLQRQAAGVPRWIQQVVTLCFFLSALSYSLYTILQALKIIT